MDASFNVAHLIATIGLVLTLAKCGSDFTAVQVTHTAEIAHLKESRAEVLDKLDKIDEKLDALIERKNGFRK